ncbi:hypothetical protein [Escherichia coli]|uniref:hypothetical protein n=1 Tax=Escherichia coli TaxID=562 RepID=UPI002023B9E3|nr:hypothetical protein [Escherichia coli]
MKTSPSAESGRRADRLLPGGESPSAVHFFGVSPAVDLSDGAATATARAVVRGRRKVLTPAAKVLWLVHLPRTAARVVVASAPESPQRETGRRGGGRRVDCAIRRSGLHRQVCRERRFRRDRGGATGTVAAGPVFRHRTVAAARNRASGFGGDWRVRQQLPVGVGPTTGCRRQPGAEGVPASGHQNNRNDKTEKCLTP